MTTLDEEIAALREAIASGALKVRTRVNGVEKEVTYDSTSCAGCRLAAFVARRSSLPAIPVAPDAGDLGDRTRAGRRRLTLAFDGRGGPSITG